MAPQISLNELYAMNKKKQSFRKLSYERVLELCHRRIRTVATYGGMNAFFEVPGMIVGYPLYHVHDCLDHMVESLRGSGFLVQILPPPHIAVVYISWDPQELNPPKARSRLALEGAPGQGGGLRGRPRALEAGGGGGGGGRQALPPPEDPRSLKPYRDNDILRLF